MFRIGARATARVLAVSLLGASAVLQPIGATAATAMHRTADVLPVAALGNRLGAAPAEAPMRVQLALTNPREAQEEALAAAVVDPRSPQYHKFLTPHQYAGRFRLPADVRGRVLRWLHTDGVRVDRVSGVGDLIAVSGTVASLQRLFAVHLDIYQVDGRRFVANDTPPLVPEPVRAVVGLNTWQRFAPVRPAASWRVIGPQPQIGAFVGNVDVRKLWTAYDAPAADQGQGVHMGVFMAGNTAPVIGSLRVFEEAEHLPRVPVRVVYAQPGRPDDFASNDGAEEWALDTQSATGMSPQVSRLDLYTAKSLEDSDVVNEIAYWADDKSGPDMMNASFGTCEAFPLTSQTGRGPLMVAIGNNIQDSVEKSLRQAFTEGRTLFAASGDTGSSCTPVSFPVVGGGNGAANQGDPAQLYPAASPYVTAVGGTVLKMAPTGAREDEQSWAFGGGGSALFLPRPGWQSSESAIDRPCLLTDADGVVQQPGTICRGVPDIAALSGSLGQGLYIINYDQPTTASGTSLSSPLAMGSWARVTAAARHRIGPAAPALYRLTAAQRARDFYDVTSGELVGNGLNVPGPGWDYTSGYGVMDIAHLAADLAGGTAPVHQAGPAKVPNPRTGTTAGNHIACLPFGTSPAGNLMPDTLGDPGTTRDITSAAMALSPDGKSLVITVSGPQLGPQVELGSAATTMQVAWTYQGKSWLAQTQADLTGHVTGTVQAVGRHDSPVPGAKKAKPAQFPAKYEGHSLVMTIPLSAIGSPPRGARLSYPVAMSGSDLSTEDVAGPQYDYTVGQRCRH